jgi:short-subunit dehydrogenase
VKKLAGRTALITGGSAGIGLAIARALAKEGMDVCLAARSPEPLERAAAELRSFKVRALAIPTDVTRLEQLQSLVQTAVGELGSIDCLINNAGIETFHDFDSLPLDQIRQTIEVNVISALLLTRLVLPHMLQAKRGHIVNLGSTAGKHGPPFGAAYGASKAALIAFTQALRAEYAGSGISASAISPGFTHAGGMYERMKSQTGRQIPWYVGTTSAEAVARAVVQAIRRDKPDVVVNWPPLRPVFTLAELAPRLGDWIARVTTRRFLKAVARARSDEE